MDKTDLQSLFTHMEWADAQTWTAVFGLPDGHDARLRQLLYHTHIVQRVYLQLWQGEPIDVPAEKTLADLRAIHGWARPYYAQVEAFLRTVEPDTLKRKLAIPWTAEIVKQFGTAGDVTLGETMVQVVLHSMYHRAQAATRIRELGGEPTVTDFVAWLWRARPAPQWPAEALQR